MKVMPCGEYVVTVEVSRVTTNSSKPWAAHWAVYNQSPCGHCEPLVAGDTELCAAAEEADRFARKQAYWAGEALRESEKCC